MIDVFLERGDQLSESRKLMDGSPEYASALALVSVHCAIALNDALLIKLSGRHEPTEDHSASVTRTKTQCAAKKIRTEGLHHLQRLISAKTDVSYGEKRTSFEVATTLAVASERFETWVRPLLK